MTIRILLMIAFCWIVFSTEAQLNRKEIKTDSGLVVLHYFKGGKQISTKEWIDRDDRLGKAWAYNSEGKQIYQRETRRFAGHASVHFTYHTNGAVAIAEYSTAPDAGIQWHRDKTSFDESGNQTGFEEQGHDNYDLYPGPRTTVFPEQIVTPQPEQKTEPNPAECQRLFSNKAYVVNQTKYATRVQVKVKKLSPMFKDGLYTLAPGDTLYVGTYTYGEIFKSPESECELIFERITLKKNKKKKKSFVAVTSTTEQKMGETEMGYYVSVDGWKK
jgi:hypothetical protein